jgi:lambda repressor-like predicted transcriptional regulator
MRIVVKKLDLELARNCKSLRDLRAIGISAQTLTKAHRGEDISPKSIGIIAKALGIDPSEIIEQQ